MTFWLIAAALTVLASGAALWPLLRRQTDAPAPRAAHDVEVYGAQLRELEGDVVGGAIPSAEAGAARAEIGRRLLRAASRAQNHAGPERRRRGLALASIVFVIAALPVTSLGLYLTFGAAGLSDRPLSARLAESRAAASDMSQLVLRAEERLRTDPDDGRGWDVLAPIYLRMERPDAAATAFRNAIRVLGPSADRHGGLGEALTQLANGEVTDEARQSFERALALRSDYLPARFFLALDLSQEARYADAAVAWEELIKASPQGSPWLQIASSALADARQRSGVGETPGPSSAEVAAAEEMSQEDRRAMIEGMVSQLADRLQSAPDDVDGWKRLIRSYSVLGQSDMASEALRQASVALAHDAEAEREIAMLGRELGLPDARETR